MYKHRNKEREKENIQDSPRATHTSVLVQKVRVERWVYTYYKKIESWSIYSREKWVCGVAVAIRENEEHEKQQQSSAGRS